MKNIINRAANVMFVSAFVAIAFAVAPMSVQAADLFDGGSYYDGSYGYEDSGSYYDASYDYGDTGSYYDGSYDYGDTGSYYDGSYGYGDTSGYTGSGYSTGGYTGGGYSTGGGYGYTTPVYRPTPTYPTTPSNTNVNTNTCTNNSCNNDDHSVVNISNPAPIINNVVANYGGTNVTQPQYCAQGFYGTYPNCYLNRAPVAYNTATPYVSLSQVPYTGLELGFWGTIAYWAGFVLFALFVAYLIAIKRVQNVIALKLKNFLFGTNETEDEAVVVTTSAPARVAQVAYAAPAADSSEDVIDSFIMSQINRPRRA